MTWSTKRDGYRTSANNVSPLGRPVAPLEPQAGATHVVTIPGTRFKCFLSLDDAGMTAGDPGNRNAAPPIKVDALLKDLARTTVKGIGKRRVKVQPVLQTIAEFQALTATRAA